MEPDATLVPNALIPVRIASSAPETALMDLDATLGSEVPSPLRIAPLAPAPLDGSPAGILLRHLSAQLLRARTHASKDTWKLSLDDYATGVRRRERRGKLMKTLRAAITVVHAPDSGANLQPLLDSIQKNTGRGQGSYT
jgi:hypothetical protein